MQSGGDQGHDHQTDDRPAAGGELTEEILGDVGKIHAKEVVVQVDKTGELAVKLRPVLVDELRQIDLVVGRSLSRRAGHVAQRHRKLSDLGDDLVGQGHEVAQGGADDVVQGDKDGEGQEGPQAAGHGVDTLAGVEVGDLLLLLLLVVGVPLLDLLHLAVHTPHAEHTLLAFQLEGKENQLHHEGEEDQRDTVGACPRVEQAGEPRERHTDIVAELCKHILFFLR